MEGVISGYNKTGSAARQAKKATDNLGSAAEKAAKKQHTAAVQAAKDWRKQTAEQKLLAAHRNRIFEEEKRKLDEISAARKKSLESLKAGVKNAGIAITAVGIAFDHVSKRALSFEAASKNLPFAINQARGATKGMVDELTLMQLAITANRKGVTSTSEGFARMSSAAVKLGLTVGKDAKTSIEDLTTALGSGSKAVLENLGVILSQGEAQREYATRLGKTTKELTDQERAQAFAVIGMERAESAASKVKLELNESALAAQEFKTELVDLADKASVGFVNALATMSTGVEVLLQQMTGLDDYLNDLDARSGGRTNKRGRVGFVGESDADRQSRRLQEEIPKELARLEAQRQNAEAIRVAQGIANDASAAAKAQKGRKRRAGGGRSRGGPHDEFVSQLKAKDGFTESGDPDLFTDTADPFSTKEMERYNAEVIDLNKARQERLLEDKLRHVELERELGIEPIEAINRERDARLEYNEFLQENATTTIEREAIVGQSRQIQHEAELSRIRAEKQAKADLLNTVTRTTGAIVGVSSAGANMLGQIGEAHIKSERRVAKAKQWALGIQAFGIGALETVEAAAAFARYDYVGGALHTAAAAVAFTTGGLLAAGKAGPVADYKDAQAAKAAAATPSGGSGGGSSFGGGTAANSGATAKGPLSLPSERRRSAPQNDGAIRNGNAKTVVVNINNLNANGSIDEDFANKTARAIKDSERNLGETA